MNVSAVIFDKILFGEVSPWNTIKRSEKQFRDILDNQVRANKDNPVKFFKALLNSFEEHSIPIEIDHLPTDETIANLANFAELQTAFKMFSIPPHFNKESEFYNYLIDNECKRILTAIATNVNKCQADFDIIYQVNKLLGSIEYIIEQVSNKTNTDKLHTYVLKSLKLSLFKLYESIKAAYPAYLEQNVLSQAEIINFLAPDFESNKTIPNSFEFILNQYLTSQADQTISDHEYTQEPTLEPKPTKPPFQPKEYDFRVGKKCKVSYDDILNTVHFTDFETRLYEYDFIDIHYNFTGIHSKKKILAALFAIIIDKNFFRNRGFIHKQIFKEANIRQYLDFRYNVNTSQQFSRCTTEYKQSILDQYYWLKFIQTKR